MRLFTLTVVFLSFSKMSFAGYMEQCVRDCARYYANDEVARHECIDECSQGLKQHTEQARIVEAEFQFKLDNAVAGGQCCSELPTDPSCFKGC